MPIVNNHLTRNLILRRPRKDGERLILRPGAAQGGADLVIPPGGRLSVPFWDEIKKHPIYQSLLQRRLITLDGDETPTPGGDASFTSAGDTLAPPPGLDPAADEGAASADALKPEIAYGNQARIGKTRGRGKPSAAEGK